MTTPHPLQDSVGDGTRGAVRRKVSTMIRTFSTLLCTAAIAATVASPLAAERPTATAALMDADGKQAGTVEFQATPSGMMWIAASAEGLPEGKHGFHIHETGKCDAADGFKSAGGHLAGDAEHGVLNEGGPHPGDLPNVTVAENGSLNAEFFVSRLSVEGGWFEEAGLFDEDGSAVVVHSGADDYTSQPSGDAGNRILCGVIER